MNILPQLLLLASLIFLSAFFSASETALLSLSKLRVRHMVEERIKGADLVSRLVEDPSKLLGAILVGNNVVNIAASALATSLAIQEYGPKGVGIATILMTLAVLIFAEVTPKSLAAQNTERISLKVAGILYSLTIVLHPIIILLVNITDVIIRLFGGKINKKKPFLTEEEFMTIVNVGHEEGVLEQEEKQMIHNIVEFGDSLVKDILTPRIDMAALEISASYHEVLEAFQREGFSRIPVYEDTIDNVIGILYVKDLIFLNCEAEGFDITKHLWEPFFTYEFIKTSTLFKEMRKGRIPMAVVLDEYGGTSGIVTIEDLVEEIVGELEDEYDEQETEIKSLKENEYMVNGSTKIDLVNDILGIAIETENFDSIGGFVVGKLGRLPQVGDSVHYDDIQITVESLYKNRIEKLKITI